MKPRNRTLTILVLVTLIAVTIAYVLPVHVVLVTSLKTPVEIPPFIAFSVTALCALIGGLGSYYLSRARTAFSRFIFILVGVGMYLSSSPGAAHSKERPGSLTS
jgi:ABC-type glycerol-3-phosphate transport system permease component